LEHITGHQEKWRKIVNK